MIKNPPEKIDSEKVFHFYAKDMFLYHNLEVNDFSEKWEMFNIMVGILKTDYQEEDLDYIEVEEARYNGEDCSY